MLNYSAPFGFLFKEKDWFKKFAIASLLTYTFIGAAPVFGWMIEIVRRVAGGEEPVIPELKDWKTFWKLGGQFAFINAVWLLPLLAATIIMYLPLIFANQLQGETLLAIMGGTMCCVMLFLLVYSLVYVFFFPAMMNVLAVTGSSGKAMNPVHLWKAARPRFLPYLIVFLIVGVALFNIIFLFAALTLFLLLPPLLVYTGLVTAHYAGQLARMEQLDDASVG